MKLALLVLASVSALLVLASVSSAQSNCDDAYDQCITSCCNDCGSFLTTDDYGDLVCDVGTESDPNEACINACLPCSDQYQQCVSQSDYEYSGSSSSSCCGSAAVLGGILGFTFIKGRKR